MNNSNLPSNNNIILSGVPRSGTTLICKLLCECPNVIALNEPFPGSVFDTRESSLTHINEAFHTFRRNLLTTKKAPLRTNNGVITDNAYSVSESHREKLVHRTEVYFDKPLSPDFTLILNQNAEFTLLLPEIAKVHPFYAVIRNPLDLLSSWNTVNIPVSRGKVAKADRLLPSLPARYNQKETLYEKQVEILDWYFDQYRRIDRDHIIRYEELIDSQGKNLRTIIGNIELPVWNLHSKNNNPLYDNTLRGTFLQLLIDRQGAYMHYYSEQDLMELNNC
jgi:hypothetical protein